MFATHPIVRGMSLILYATLSMTIARPHVRVVDHGREQAADGVTDEYARFLLSGLVEETYTITTAAPGFLTSTQDISIPKNGLIRITTVPQIAQAYTERYEGLHLPVDTRSAEIVANQSTLDLYRRSPPLLDVEVAKPVRRNNVLLRTTGRDSSPRLASSSASDVRQTVSEQRPQRNLFFQRGLSRNPR